MPKTKTTKIDEELKNLLLLAASVLKMVSISQLVPQSIKAEATEVNDRIGKYIKEHGGL